MIRSMTGFGSATLELDEIVLTVEVRTVNHRHLDLSLRLPRQLSALEVAGRKAAQQGFLRGKVDVSVQWGGETRTRTTVEVDRGIAQIYLEAAHTLNEQAADLSAAQLLALPGVVKVVDAGIDESLVEAPLLEAIAEAACLAREMREVEGKALEEDLLQRLASIEAIAQQVESQSDEVLRHAKERLRRRMEQLREETGLLDEARLHQEVVIAADRMDVTEEVVRLRSHVDQFRGTLERNRGEEAVGRRLDFLLQEMGREANTIASKAGDAAVAHCAVDLKTELERIREQVQNVE